MSTKSSYLIFWILLHISADPSLVQQIRNETSPYAKATQPPQTLAIAEPPQLSIDANGLVKSCPLLKACFHECVRLHSTPTSVRSITKTFEATSPTSDSSHILEAGKFVAAPLHLHHHDPSIFESPYIFQPSRFLPDNTKRIKDTTMADKLKPWGIGSSACPGRAYAEKEVLAYVAGIFALWDFEPTDRRGWVVPGQRERAVVCVPDVDVRVRVRSRPL